MTQKNILVVEDDVTTLQLIGHVLIEHQFIPILTASGEDALEKLDTQKINAIILDMYLPGIDGLEVLRRVRTHPKHHHTPILILTASQDKLNAVIALEVGADDYITKPFYNRELIARLSANLRRVERPSQITNVLHLVDIKIDLEKRLVMKGDTLIPLTFGEYELLVLLAKNAGKVFSRDTLLSKLWGDAYIAETRVIDMHISSLRKKLMDDNKQIIETVRGVGYRIRQTT